LSTLDFLNNLFSPTHKQTKGRVPVWGSEFTTKDAALQGGFGRNRSYAERKIMGSGGCAVVVVVVVVVVRSRVSGTARAQKLQAGEERAVLNLESTPKESSKMLWFTVGLWH
jgi:hypothetical protein